MKRIREMNEHQSTKTPKGTSTRRGMRRNKKMGRDVKKERDVMTQKLLYIAEESREVEDSSTWDFKVGGSHVCVHAWAIVNGWKRSRVYQRMKEISEGKISLYNSLIPPGEKTLDTNGYISQNVIAWLDRYAAEMGDHLPVADFTGRAHIIHLPQSKRKNVWCEYVHDNPKGTAFFCSRSYFGRVWRRDRKLIQISRLAGSKMSLCDKCTEYKVTLQKVRGDTDYYELYNRYRGHIMLQSIERATYYKRRELGISQQQRHLSCIMDGMDQSKQYLPHGDVSTKTSFGKKSVKQGLYAVHFHGHVTYLIPHPPHVRGGANFTCQALYESLVRLRQDVPQYANGLPRTLLLQVDNTAKDAKNQVFMAFLSSLIEEDVFDTIVLSFLLKGHTHEDIDQLFSVISKKLRVSSVMSFDMFDRVLANAFEGDRTSVIRCIVYRIYACMDFTLKLTGRRAKAADLPPEAELDQGHCYIDKHFKGHSIPHSFLFHAQDDCHGNRICMMRYRAFSCAEEWHPKHLEAVEITDNKAEELALEHLTFMRRKLGLTPQHTTTRESKEGGDDEGTNVGTATGNSASTTSDISMTSAAAAHRLNETYYQGLDIFSHESQKSLLTFSQSNGIRLLTSKIESWDDLRIQYPKPIAGLEAVKADVYGFFDIPNIVAKYGEKGTAVRTTLEEEWDSFFESIPVHPNDNINRCVGFEIEELKNASRERARIADITAMSTRKIVAAAEVTSYGEREPITFSSRTKTMRTRRDKVAEENKAAEEMVALRAGTYVIVLRDVSDQHFEGMDGVTEEEESNPIMVARVKRTVDSSDASALVSVQWYRQPKGDPNKKYTKGILAGRGQKPWEQDIERGSVVMANITLNKGGKIPAAVKQKIAELQNPMLEGWVYEAGRRGFHNVL